MSFPRYAAYKCASQAWLGQLPSHWTVQKFRYLFRESSEKITDKVVGPMLSVSGYRGIEIKEYDDENRRRLDEELVGYRIVRPGQLVVNTMWLNYAGLGISAYEGHVSPAYRSYWIDTHLERRFVHFLMRSSFYVQGYTRLLTGIRPNSLQMSREDLQEFSIIVPPVGEQLEIAAFLDRETAKIDALVAEQERLIELLKEKRQAVISQAVTKGLTQDVPVKSSGIEWIGDIPCHWAVGGLTRFLEPVVDYRGRTPTKQDEGIFLVTARNIRKGKIDYSISQEYVAPESAASLLNRGKPEIGDLLFTTEAPLGQVALVDRADVAIAQRIVKLRGKAGVLDNRFLMYWMMSDPCQARLGTLATGSTALGIKASKLGMIECLVPPMSEQADIASYCDREAEACDKLVRGAESVIELLSERRSAIISAAVTGQIDVRGLAEQKVA